MKKIIAITAGLSQPSSTRMLADRLSEATTKGLENFALDAEITVVELREHAHAITDMLLTGFPSAELREVIDTVKSSDGIIAVTPIFSAGPSGLFKSFLDLFRSEDLENKPVLLGATGGTARHSMVMETAIRPVLTYLRTNVATIATFAATEDWSGTEDANPLPARIERAGAQFADMVNAYKNSGPIDEFDNAPSFLDLLNT